MAWRLAAARRRGEAHARRGERGQDAWRALPVGDALVAAAADGAGSAPRGGAGAALAVRAATDAARAALSGAVADLSDADAEAWVDAARARLTAAAAAPLRDLAATLIAAAADASGAVVAHVGDGAAVARVDGAWRALSWPEGGDHAGETRFLTDDAPAVRVSRVAGPVTALALLTDGIERLVLDFAAQEPHAPFFERMIAPVAALPQPGRDAALSAKLAAWLGGEAVATRTDDDRTLLLAATP